MKAGVHLNSELKYMQELIAPTHRVSAYDLINEVSKTRLCNWWLLAITNGLTETPICWRVSSFQANFVTLCHHASSSFPPRRQKHDVVVLLCAVKWENKYRGGGGDSLAPQLLTELLLNSSSGQKISPRALEDMLHSQEAGRQNFIGTVVRIDMGGQPPDWERTGACAENGNVPSSLGIISAASPHPHSDPSSQRSTFWKIFIPVHLL